MKSIKEKAAWTFRIAAWNVADEESGLLDSLADKRLCRQIPMVVQQLCSPSLLPCAFLSVHMQNIYFWPMVWKCSLVYTELLKTFWSIRSDLLQSRLAIRAAEEGC